MPIDNLITSLIPRVLTPSNSVEELLTLFDSRPQPNSCYAVVRLAADAYDVLALADLDEAARQFSYDLLDMSLAAVPGLLRFAAPVSQSGTGEAAARRALHATPRGRLVVLDDYGDVAGILVAHTLSGTKGGPLELLQPAVLSAPGSTSAPHLNTRFENLDPGQPLPVGRHQLLTVWVGPAIDAARNRRSEPFRFRFADEHSPVEFLVHLHADPEAWNVNPIETTMIVAPPGVTSQEAVFMVTAQQPGRDTLYVTVERADTGVTVQHLCLPVYAVQTQSDVALPVAQQPVSVSLPLEDVGMSRHHVEIVLHPGENRDQFTAMVRADLEGHRIWERYQGESDTSVVMRSPLLPGKRAIGSRFHKLDPPRWPEWERGRG